MIMCSNPITIVNPTRNYYRGLTPGKVTVPCGKCHSCQLAKRNEWFVRANAEYEYYTKVLHGQVYFITLTYDNEHLPHFNLRDTLLDAMEANEIALEDLPLIELEKVKEKLHYGDYVTHYKLQNLPCFSVEDIQLFIKQLRTDIKRKTIYDSEGIKYLICSEFGEKFGRPHYHGLFFLPFEINAHTFLSLVRKAWKRGIVSYSRSFPHALSNNLACKYTTKYITKDFAFQKKYDLDYYLNFLNQYDSLFDLKKQVKSIMPFHVQSLGFGCPLLSMALKDFPISLAHDKFDVNSYELSDYFKSNELHIDNDKFVYQFPQYIKRKVLYDVYKETHYTDQANRKKKTNYIYVPNRLYTEYLAEKFTKIKQSTIDYLNKVCTYNYLNFHTDIYKEASVSKHELFQIMSEVLSKYPKDVIADYLLVYRNVCRNTEFSPEDIASCSPMELWIMQKSYYEYELGKLKLPIGYKQTKLSKRAKMQDNNNAVSSAFPDLEFFLRNLEAVLGVFNKHKDAYKEYVNMTLKDAKIDENISIYNHV